MGGTKTIAKVSLFTAIIEQYLFSGLILGWASLVYIMKEEKFFADLCDETTGRKSWHFFIFDGFNSLEEQNVRSQIGSPEEKILENYFIYYHVL